jgi:hypothetical protein
MGAEALCRLTYEGRTAIGKALLETTELHFRGDDMRLKIPFLDITSLTAKDGELSVAFGTTTNVGEASQPRVAVFAIGPPAEAWAAKIRNPRGLVEKLGVKPGQRVCILGVTDADFLSQLRSATDRVTEGALDPASEVVFYEADTPGDLSRLPELRSAIVPRGAIWVVSTKGKGAAVKDTDVMAAARAVGLVDTKVVSFSNTHTALKLVLPVAKR